MPLFLLGCPRREGNGPQGPGLGVPLILPGSGKTKIDDGAGTMKKQLAIFLILVFGHITGSANATEFRLELFAEVRGLAAKGEFAKAERLVEDAFRASSDASPVDRIGLLDTLAGLQIESGKYSDAGDTYWNKAEIIARDRRSTAPELATVYAASGAAYMRAASAQRAVEAFEAALRVDRLYQKCDGNVLAALYRNLADAYRAAGQIDAATRSGALADDPVARCAKFHPTRGVARVEAEGEGEFALVKVLYATDRKTTGSERASEVFGWERGAISYGEAEVTIPRIHKPGNIEAPSLLTFTWEENPDLHIVLLSVNPVPEREFFADIGKTLGEGGNDEVFLFIHGFNVTFADAAKRTAQLVYDLNFEGSPIFYSWPSRGQAGSYMADAASVQVSARHLTGFLEDLVTRSGAKHIQIVAHSMGNRALTEALEFYALRHPDATGVFDQIIFAAPDVDSELFVFQTKVFKRLARRMTLYTSDADLALSTSRQLYGNPRAGLAADTPLVADGFDTIDMSVVGDGLLNHSYFASDASALSDMLWLFWRNPPPSSRCGMVDDFGDDGEYWVYVAEKCKSNLLLPALSLARLGGENAVARLDTRIAKLRAQSASGLATDLLQELMKVRLVLVDLLSR